MGHVARNVKHGGRYWIPLLGLIVTLSMAVAGIVYLPRHDVHASTGDWPTFLGSNARTGFNANETTINPTTAPNLKLKWTAQTKGHVSSESLVVNGVIYWGSWDGLMHATDASAGKDIWATNIGTKPGSCGQNYGIVGSATVANVTIAGIVTQVVFVAGGQDDVLALNTINGHIIWQTNLGNAKGEFLYSSTSFYNNSVYVGVSSFGDCPLVQGQVVQLAAPTGTIQNTFNVVPNGCTGGAVWGSLTIDETSGMLYFGTGNAGKCPTKETMAPALIELNSANLSLVAAWPVPSSDAVNDGDYGSTPTLFQATINAVQHQMVGLVNKDGYYYALDRTNIGAGSLWKVRISVGGSGPETGDGSISTSTYDGTNLYVGGGKTTINGQQCTGSLRAMDPNTENFLWQMCFSSPVLDPIIAVPGLVVVGWSNNMYIVNSATGQKVFSYQDSASNGKFWSAATIANGVLYDGSRSGNVFAFQVPSAGTPTPSPSPSSSPSVTPSSTPGTTIAQDDFTRNNQSLWGKASDTQTWGADANKLSNFSISTNMGQVTSTGSNSTSYNAVLGPSATDAEVVTSGSLSSFGTNTLGAVLRWTDANDFYKAYLTGTSLVISKKVGGTVTKLKSVAFTATAGTSYTIDFSVVGTTLSASVWQTGSTPPSSWMLTTTDSSFSSGFCGVLVYLANTVNADFTSFLATSQ